MPHHVLYAHETRVTGMRQSFTPPWTDKIYRDTHGRGCRRPTFGVRLPRYRTRSGMFDDMVAGNLKRLNGAWPELIRPVQFAVEDVPASDPAPWEDEPNCLSRAFPASHGIPARIVLYRMPMQMPHGASDAYSRRNGEPNRETLRQAPGGNRPGLGDVTGATAYLTTPCLGLA